MASKGPSEPRPNVELFEVTGAGQVGLGKGITLCGDKSGMSFAVSWGEFRWAGGTLSWQEVIRMKDAMQSWLNENTPEQCEQVTNDWRERVRRRNESSDTPAIVEPEQ